MIGVAVVVRLNPKLAHTVQLGGSVIDKGGPATCIRDDDALDELAKNCGTLRRERLSRGARVGSG